MGVDVDFWHVIRQATQAGTFLAFACTPTRRVCVRNLDGASLMLVSAVRFVNLCHVIRVCIPCSLFL